MEQTINSYAYYEEIARKSYGREPSWSEVMEIKEELENENKYEQEENYTYGQMQMRAWGA